MKFIVASGELQKALQIVSGVISSSQSRPILENFLFELDRDIKNYGFRRRNYALTSVV
jgi:DNA polymerase-3 subunit beta